MEHLQYPIGRFHAPEYISAERLATDMNTLTDFPQRLRDAVATLSDAQLDTPYREGGWTVRQVVHHCADSHSNALNRLKLALTEDAPNIKPYAEDLWATLADSSLPVESSLMMLQGMHARWVAILQSLSAQERARTFVHPQYGKIFTIDAQTALYGWHSAHHLAHITELKKRNGWQ